MTFKCLLQSIVEKITGKRCEQCKYNNGFLCKHPDPSVNEKCRNCIFPFGFERRNKKVAQYIDKI